MALNIVKALRTLTANRPTRGGYGITSEMSIPPDWSTVQYLEAYGKVGWLFGAVSLIATSVAEVEWHLFKGDKELDTHPLLDLLDRPNPFQTRYELFMLMQTYQCLLGKNFLALNFAGRLPAEMWIAPPQYMSIIPDKETYIKGYQMRAGTENILFMPWEIIYMNAPNPLNPMGGMGVVQPIATDLQNEIYATKYTNKLFYNDGIPGLAVEIPEMYSREQRVEYMEEWDKRHSGWTNARKTAFLFGGAKINNVTMTNKDMDFEALRKLDRETILGAFHIPTSLMGLAEVGSRARAEADEYIFAKRVVKPALQLIKESLNEQLCPLFGPDLVLTFDNPIPANEELIGNNTRANLQTGIITREEARVALGYDPVPADGEMLMMPFSLTPVKVGDELLKPELPEAPEPDSESTEDEDEDEEKGLEPSESQMERKWYAYIAKTEALERPFTRTLRTYWNEQARIVLANFARNPSLEGATFGDDTANANFVARFKPIIANVVREGWNDALREFSKGVRKQQFDMLSLEAYEWIATRSLSLATMVNGTTKKQLRAVLAEAFAAGKSIDDITRSIRVFYRDGYENRAPMVARTEVITASNQGANQLYKSEGVTKVQWYVALDERTCDECMALHKEVFPIDEGPRPALHPQCRCVITAHLTK